jgi:hypothetical protein
MGPQYQATVDSYAASPQAGKSAGNQTLGKAMEQSPVHNGFGTGSSMYDNDMAKGYQPAPVAMPPQPQNQPSTAGITPSWAQEQKPLKKGGRAKRADGGSLAALFGSMGSQPQSLMRTGDTVKDFGQAQPMMPPASQQPAAMPTSAPMPMPAPNQGASSPASLTSGAASSADPYDVYLNQLYSKNLNRQPDLEGLNFWKDVLKSGTKTQSQIEKDFLGSQEYHDMPYSEFVKNLYMQNLNRAADPSGLSYWQNILKSGKETPEQIKQGFLNSEEFKNRQTTGALAEQNALSPGIIADKSGTMDPFVAQYNARLNAAQNIYGNIAKQNYAAAQEQQKQYEKALEVLTKSNEQKLSEAEVLKQQQDAAAAAKAEQDRQNQLLFLILSMQK